MIFIRPLPYEAIKRQLLQTDVITLAGCLACAQTSGFGEGRMRELAEHLRRDGFTVRDGFFVPSACSPKAQSVRADEGRTVLVALCCSAGCRNLERYFPRCRIVSAAEDVGLMTADSENGTLTVVMPGGESGETPGKTYPLYVGDGAVSWR